MRIWVLRSGEVFVLAIPLNLRQGLEPAEFKSREVVGVKCALHRIVCVALVLGEHSALLANTV